MKHYLVPFVIGVMLGCASVLPSRELGHAATGIGIAAAAQQPAADAALHRPREIP